ncbi:MAG: hypothetical protein Q8P13_01525 [bacterium]|nr:hypothetical protein [bacterium]
MAIIDDILVQLIDFTYHPYKMMYGDLRKTYKAESVRIALSRAQKKGWLERSWNDDGTYLKLTDLGKERMLKYKPVSKLLPWQMEEGEVSYCVVVFDIPEKSRSTRDLLRRKLKEAGFVGWQKSVWVGKNINLEKLREFLKEVGLENHVLAIETSDLGDEALVKELSTFR